MFAALLLDNDANAVVGSPFGIASPVIRQVAIGIENKAA